MPGWETTWKAYVYCLEPPWKKPDKNVIKLILHTALCSFCSTVVAAFTHCSTSKSHGTWKIDAFFFFCIAGSSVFVNAKQGSAKKSKLVGPLGGCEHNSASLYRIIWWWPFWTRMGVGMPTSDNLAKSGWEQPSQWPRNEDVGRAEKII